MAAKDMCDDGQDKGGLTSESEHLCARCRQNLAHEEAEATMRAMAREGGGETKVWEVSPGTLGVGLPSSGTVVYFPFFTTHEAVAALRDIEEETRYKGMVLRRRRDGEK